LLLDQRPPPSDIFGIRFKLRWLRWQNFQGFCKCGSRLKSGDCRGDTGIEMIFAKVFQQTRLPHPIAHGASDLCEEQLDLVGAEIAAQIAQHVGRANIQIGAGGQIE
jgi:hypothetical protein